jgi:hypothetical protein
VGETIAAMLKWPAIAVRPFNTWRLEMSITPARSMTYIAASVAAFSVVSILRRHYFELAAKPPLVLGRTSKCNFDFCVWC